MPGWTDARPDRDRCGCTRNLEREGSGFERGFHRKSRRIEGKSNDRTRQDRIQGARVGKIGVLCMQTTGERPGYFCENDAENSTRIGWGIRSNASMPQGRSIRFHQRPLLVAREPSPAMDVQLSTALGPSCNSQRSSGTDTLSAKIGVFQAEHDTDGDHPRTYGCTLQAGTSERRTVVHVK